MAESKIELRKIRDFGANLSDTFEFIRQNFKPLLMSFFAISGIFILLQAISYGAFEYKFFGNISRSAAGVGANNLLFMEGMFSHYFTWPFYLYMVFAWLGYAAMNVCAGAYVKYYNSHQQESPGVEDVWKIFKKYFLRVLIYTIPVAILASVGFLFFILPGIFLTVVFVPFPWVLMMEDASLGDAIQRCFELNRKFFWQSLGIYLIAFIIYSFASGVLGLLIGGLAGLIGYFTTRNIGSTIGIVTSVLRVFTYLFYIIFLVSAMLQYFNLTEQHDATGIMQRIDQMGNANDKNQGTAEQY